MAESDSTLGNRFAKSKFLAKPDKPHSFDHLMINDPPCFSPLIDEQFAELMETLRVHINDVLRLPMPAQKRSHLVRNYWELEYLVKEVRLLLEPDALKRLKQDVVLSP